MTAALVVNRIGRSLMLLSATWFIFGLVAIMAAPR